LLGPVGGKFMRALAPVQFVPLVESVAEHHISTWSWFFSGFELLLILALLGFVFALRRRTEGTIYLILFGLTSLHVASCMVRLILILAPAFALLAGLGAAELMKPFARMVRGFPREAGHPAFGGAVMAFIFLTIASILPHSITFANVPVTISSATISVAPIEARAPYLGDWLEACAWLRDNTPADAVVCCWWDYGYYVTVIGNRTSLADNATIDAKSIEDIARAYMATEARTDDGRGYLDILERYNATHVLVFTTLAHVIFQGDETKWHWMWRIGGEGGPDEGTRKAVSESLRERYRWLPEGWLAPSLPSKDSLLMRSILHGIFPGEYPPPENCRLAFESSLDLVFIYEVSY
jgi:dolichyl-diphosphooligosaccharide--protein glycosyltransferase